MPSSVNLGSMLEDFVGELVANGRYGSRSEVLREGVRLVHEREEWLRRVQGKVATAREQVARGEGVELDEAFAPLRSRFANR